MPQSGWDDPTEQVGPTPGSTGVVRSAVAGQPVPLDGTEPLDGTGPLDGSHPSAAGPLVPDQAGPGLPRSAGRPAAEGQPGASGPAPDQVDPAPVPEPSAGEPGLGPGAAQPGAAQPGAVQPGAVGPGAGQSEWGQLAYGGGPLVAPGQPLPPAGWRPLPPAPRRPSWQPTRSEIRAGLLAILLLAVVGAGVAVLWWQVAPRLGFRVVTPGNPEPVTAEQEQFFATDGWYMLLTLVVGILATVLGWRVKALRGPVGLVALAVGSLLGAVITWRGGLLLGPAPTEAQLQIMGKVVYPALRLRATAALMVEPLAVVGTYLLLVGFSARPDLGRPDGDGPPPLPSPY
jgi:hypothetical protein